MLAILPTLLHVEDDPNDRLFLHAAVRQADLPIQLEAANDGQAAIEYLCGTAPFGDRARYPVPALVLLDLKMRRKSGFDVLAWLRSQPEYTCLPVVIFTSSRHEADIRKAYEMGANSYLLKPLVFDDLVETVRDIHHYWYGLNKSQILSTA